MVPRIATHRKAARPRFASSPRSLVYDPPVSLRVVVLLLFGAAAACGGSQAPRAKPAPAAPVAEPEPEKPLLDLMVEPADAEVQVDDQRVGTGESLTDPLPLDPGTHRIVVEKAGYETWRAEVALEQGTEVIQVRLKKKKR